MAKRRCTTTAEEVLERWDDLEKDLEMGSSDLSDDEQLQWPEDIDELDDPDEPIMEGSDDEFSDLREVEEDEDDDNLFPTTSSPCSSEVHTSPSCITPTSPSITHHNTHTPTNTDNCTLWSSTLNPVTIKPFRSPVGPTIPISASPLEVFQLFFSEDLMENIVRECNRYASQVMGDEKFQEWRAMNVDKLKAFLGFVILMAIIHLPSTDDYWRRDPFMHYTLIADRISCDRFRELSRYLHFVDNTTLLPRYSAEYNRLEKVRPLIDHLSQKFRSLYKVNQEVAVDEAMIKFQGRSSLKQYMPLKPTKRSIKVWVLADSHNGYFSQFEVYTGKKGNTAEKDLGMRVVKTLS